MKSIAVGGKFQIVLLHEVKVLIAIGGKLQILLTQVSNRNKSNILLKTYNIITLKYSWEFSTLTLSVSVWVSP